jgi:YggT family protein
MNIAIAQIISLFFNLMTLLIIADALMSFFMSPFHPVRAAVRRILEPIYAPIRKVIPPIGMMDITPIVVIILLQVIETIVLSLLL